VISDVLRDGLKQIESFQREYPQYYGAPNTSAQIASVKEAMQSVLSILDDTPPPAAAIVRSSPGQRSLMLMEESATVTISLKSAHGTRADMVRTLLGFAALLDG
jgi:hypothetical protein